MYVHCNILYGCPLTYEVFLRCHYKYTAMPCFSLQCALQKCTAITNALQCSAFHCYFHYKNTLQYKCNAMLCFSLHCTLQQEKIHYNTNAMFCVSLYITADALVYKSIINHWICFFIWSFTSFNSFTPVHICRKNQLIHTGIYPKKSGTF